MIDHIQKAAMLKAERYLLRKQIQREKRLHDIFEFILFLLAFGGLGYILLSLPNSY